MSPSFRRRRSRTAERESPSAPSNLHERSRLRVVEPEDFLLVAWLLIAEVLLLRLSGGRSPEMWIEPSAGSFPWNIPWTAWLVILSLGFVVFTRGESDVTLDVGIGRRILLFGPAFPLLSILAMVVSLIRGGPKSVGTLGGGEADWPMPQAPEWARRTAAVPAILVGESAFRATLSRDLPGLVGQFSPDPAEAFPPDRWDQALEIGFGLFLLAIPYLFIVIGPRVAAGATTNWRYWLLRFALFALAAVTGGRLLANWAPLG